LKTVVFWPYVYEDHLQDASWSWATRFNWLSQAFQSEGYEVLQHPKFLCDLKGSKPYDGESDCDIVVYNHCDITQVKGDVINAGKTFIFKPTVPDGKQTTLDELGYGSYSSITYDKPDFESISDEESGNFFDTRVKEWKDKNTSKWGENHFEPRNNLIKENDYYLVVGQCGGDSVVNHQDFGSYFDKLKSVVNYLLALKDRHVVVKLHPYMNGHSYVKGRDKDYIAEFKHQYESISGNGDVTIIGDFTSIHSLLPDSYCVVVGNSGAGFEAMMHHKPIISFCFPEYHWVTYDLRKLCDIHRAVKVDEWFDEKLSDKFLCWYMDKYCFYDDQSAKRRIKELI